MIAAIVIAVSGLATRAVAKADEADPLFKAEVLVTGTGEAERLRGFRQGLTEIAVKLTGDAALETDGRFAPMMAETPSVVASFTYEDRMKDFPIHDEQGTRDRPYILRITADRTKMQSLLTPLGLPIWHDRPEIRVFLFVQTLKKAYLLGAEREEISGMNLLGIPLASMRLEGYEQREVLKSIGRRRGLSVALPALPVGEHAIPGHSGVDLEGLDWDPLGHTGSAQTPHAEQDVPPHPQNARYKAVLRQLASGYWDLDTVSWRVSREGTLQDTPQCFAFHAADVTFDEGLRKSMDAFEAWLIRDKDATRCGMPSP